MKANNFPPEQLRWLWKENKTVFQVSQFMMFWALSNRLLDELEVTSFRPEADALLLTPEIMQYFCQQGAKSFYLFQNQVSS